MKGKRKEDKFLSFKKKNISKKENRFFLVGGRVRLLLKRAGKM